MAKLSVSALKQVLQSSLTSLWCKVATADNVYVTGGVQLDLTPGKILDPKALGVVGPSSPPTVTPGISSASLGGYMPVVVPATGTGTSGLSTYKLQFWNGTAELAAGAYPAAISAGNIILLLSFGAD